MPVRKSLQNVYIYDVHIIHNMSSATLKKNSGLHMGSFVITETTTPMAIHAWMDIKNSILRPELKLNTNPCQLDHSVDKLRLHRNFNLQCSQVVHIILRQCKLRTNRS